MGADAEFPDLAQCLSNKWMTDSVNIFVGGVLMFFILRET